MPRPSAPAQPSSSRASSNHGMPELPGMTYDPVRNRYFKLPPSGETGPPPAHVLPAKRKEPATTETVSKRPRPPARVIKSLFDVVTGEPTAPFPMTTACRTALAITRKPHRRFRIRQHVINYLSNSVWRSCRGHLIFVNQQNICHADDRGVGPFPVVSSFNNTLYFTGSGVRMRIPAHDTTALALHAAAPSPRIAHAQTIRKGPQLALFTLTGHSLQTQMRQCPPSLGKSDILSLRWLPCGSAAPVIVSGFRNGCIAIWDLRSQPPIMCSAGPGPVIDLQYDNARFTVCRSGNHSRNLATYDIRVGLKHPYAIHAEHTNQYKKVSCDVHKGLLACGGDDGIVRVWDAARDGGPLVSVPVGGLAERVCLGDVDKHGEWAGGLWASVDEQLVIMGVP